MLHQLTSGPVTPRFFKSEFIDVLDSNVRTGTISADDARENKLAVQKGLQDNTGMDSSELDELLKVLDQNLNPPNLDSTQAARIP